MDRDALADRWRALFPINARNRNQPGCVPGASEPAGGVPRAIRQAFDDLVAHYTNPSRHYHTLDHIAGVLDVISLLDPAPPPALLLAGWLHDVIYDSRAGDNEERSAEYARRVLSLLDVPGNIRDETARLILLTKSHTAEADDSAGQVLLDADLAILGAAPAVYDAYAAMIQREYAWVPEKDYRAGRRRILERFLARPRLYFTERMFAQSETRARANLEREIALLAGSAPLTSRPGEG